MAQGGGLLSANPEESALANARAMQDLQLAANATQAGQQQTAFGAGLFGQGSSLLNQYQQGQVGALSPFQSTLGLQTGIEGQGQNALSLGTSLGGNAANAGANVGNSLLRGGLSAAATMQPANAFNPYANILQGFGSNPYVNNMANSQWNSAWGQQNSPVYQPGSSSFVGPMPNPV